MINNGDDDNIEQGRSLVGGYSPEDVADIERARERNLRDLYPDSRQRARRDHTPQQQVKEESSLAKHQRMECEAFPPGASVTNPGNEYQGARRATVVKTRILDGVHPQALLKFDDTGEQRWFMISSLPRAAAVLSGKAGT